MKMMKGNAIQNIKWGSGSLESIVDLSDSTTYLYIWDLLLKKQPANLMFTFSLQIDIQFADN